MTRTVHRRPFPDFATPARHFAKRLFAAGSLLIALAAVSFAAGDAEIPRQAPDDAVMAPRAEIEAMARWVAAALTGAGPASEQRSPKIEVRRQDHNVLRFGQSCMETPIRIGQQEFKRGLGTHANSVLAVAVPAGAKAFRAAVGVDNNYDTEGKRGTVQFAVEIGGKEVFRTPTLKGGGAAAPVDVALGVGIREIVLKVDATADGPACDQADWADARFLLDDGTTLWVDGLPEDFVDAAIPYSFRYGGAASGDLLKSWPRTSQATDGRDSMRHDVAWTDPKTGLRVSAAVTVFKRYPAVDWVLWFENRGSRDTPLLENVQALDVLARTGIAKKEAVLDHLIGDSCNERTFQPVLEPIEAGKTLALAPVGGRPSNGAFPFFNLRYGNEGLMVGIGWSGQWAASLVRSDAGPTRVQAGMENTRLVLRPGERIRTPRILLMAWKGDCLAAHNRFRRLLLFHYVPKGDPNATVGRIANPSYAGQPLRLPIAGQCFDRYWQSRPGWDTEAEQIRTARAVHRAGCDTYWLDAAWFQGGFPNGVGNWFPKPQGFPRGMKPLSEACHAMGMKFMMWFEPERVAAGSLIANEHPEFVFGGKQGGLFKLNDPAARRFLTDLLSRRITEFGLDVYRNDFNIDPLPFWRANDPPDRQGITEIRYVEGHWAMWDELIARHPGLWIDNCASGGRRIDLESIMRSVPLWRSDTSCSPGHPEWNQIQTHGLSLFVPLATACVWTPDAYDVRSTATAGLICQFDYLGPAFSAEKAQAALREARENQKFFYGDFYPLTSANLDKGQWMAYQFHRADLNAGIVLAFRRGESNYAALEARLQGVDPNPRYVVELIDDDRRKTVQTMSGRQLASDMELRIPKRAASLLVRYRLGEK